MHIYSDKELTEWAVREARRKILEAHSAYLAAGEAMTRYLGTVQPKAWRRGCIINVPWREGDERMIYEGFYVDANSLWLRLYDVPRAQVKLRGFTKKGKPRKTIATTEALWVFEEAKLVS